MPCLEVCTQNAGILTTTFTTGSTTIRSDPDFWRFRGVERNLESIYLTPVRSFVVNVVPVVVKSYPFFPAIYNFRNQEHRGP